MPKIHSDGSFWEGGGGRHVERQNQKKRTDREEKRNIEGEEKGGWLRVEEIACFYLSRGISNRVYPFVGRKRVPGKEKRKKTKKEESPKRKKEEKEEEQAIQMMLFTPSKKQSTRPQNTVWMTGGICSD